MPPRIALVCLLGAIAVAFLPAVRAETLQTRWLSPQRLEVRVASAAPLVLDIEMLPARRGAPQVDELGIAGARLVRVRIPEAKGPRFEAALALVEGGRLDLLWRGRLGPLDADGETTQELEVNGGALVLFQTDRRFAGCDDKPLRLFERRFDPATRALVPPGAAEAGPGSPGDGPGVGPPTVLARRDPAPRREAPRVRFPFTITTAPPLAAREPDARDLVAPLEVNDGDPDTVWMAADSAGGQSEVLLARAASRGHRISGLRILPGHTGSFAEYLAHGRPTELLVVLGSEPGQALRVVLPEAPADRASFRRPLWVPLREPVAATCASVRVTKVAPGKSRASSALAELSIFTDFDGPGGVNRLVATLAEPDCESRIGDVVALGVDALDPLAASLGGRRPQGEAPAGQRCVLEALRRLLDHSGSKTRAGRLLPQLLTALDQASADEEQPLFQLLARIEPVPLAALEKRLLDAQRPPEERLRVARALGALPHPDARRALLAAVGASPEPLRLGLRNLVSKYPPRLADLRAAFDATPKAELARRADLVVLSAHTAGAEAPAASASLAAWLIERARDSDEPFEVKARALLAVGALSQSDQPTVAALGEIREKEPDAVLRRFATRALSRADGAAAVQALLGALLDPDPEVREIAAGGLGRKRHPDARERLVAEAMKEPWPSVRRAQIEALGNLCGEPATDLMVRAVERDVDEVRRSALVALLGCRDRRAPGLLLGVLRDGRHSPDARAHAAALLARAAVPSAGTASNHIARDMAAALSDLAADARGDLALEATAAATLLSLARIGGPYAERAALSLSEDERPGLRRTAFEALRHLCPARLDPKRLEQATRDPDAGVASAAERTLRQCQRRQPDGALPSARVTSARQVGDRP